MGSSTSKRLEPELAHLIVHQRPELEKSQDRMVIHPLHKSPSDLRVLFFPFYVSEQAGGDFDAGRRVGRVFWRTWLQEEVFSAMEFEDLRKWPGSKGLRQIAQDKGADLYVQGQLTHYMEGGTQGRSSVSMLVNIYTVAQDELIWSMEHSGRMQRQTEKDFILFKTKSWMPEHPVYVIVNNLAQDLAREVEQWTLKH
ncbi:MAG: hypothetical protein R6U22_06560 [Desulfohalobiaceae bacterium]